MIKRLLAVTLCAAAVLGVSVSAALAGEVKGPPYQGAPVAGGIVTPANATGATHARSLCAFSGLNDYDSLIGQNSKQVQTPADGPPGAPGLGLEIFPGVVVSCRGN
ncbi:MAG: hypothetical protein ABIR67_14410 [Gaiellaceae bacterium]